MTGPDADRRETGEFIEASRFGFRRRCGWCAVVLRGWQLNLCRRCHHSAVYSPSPPCPQGSRWNAPPDEWRPPWRRR